MRGGPEGSSFRATRSALAPGDSPARAVSFVTKRSHVRQPGAVAVVAAAHDREERPLGSTRRRAGLPIPDAAIVELADGCHFGSGTGEERLVREIDLVAREALLAARDPELGEQPEHHVTRDAAENGGQWRGLGHAARDDEHVLAARLGYVAVDVQQQGLVVAGAPDLVRREDRVDVVAARLRLGE